VDPFYNYFGSGDVTVVLETSDNFDGATQTGTPTIDAGLVIFPPQVGGGLVDFHKAPVKIANIYSFPDGGTITVTMVYATGVEVIMAALNNSAPHMTTSFMLPADAKLKFTSTGGATARRVSITSAKQFGSL